MEAISMSSKRINPKQRDFFNARAEIWDNISVHDNKKVEYILNVLAIQSHETVLDIGTGTGIMIPYYERQLIDGRIVAVDYSENMIEMARSKYLKDEHPIVSFVVSDLYDLEYDSEFDLVVCYSCFPHFVDQPLAVALLSKALREGGRLAVAHSDSSKKINGIHMEGGVEISNDFLPSMEQLKRMMTDCGLTVIFERDDENYFICVAKKRFAT
jgi:demethylmenaquinone methyltransferase/2-methoxy-6-polyprenyl-1,4-benzoquinol methylase